MRLELTRRTDLAIRALRELAAAGERMGRAQLAELLDTTPDVLARVMIPLVARGWVASQPGRAGGYESEPAAQAVSVHDVIDAVEGVPPDDVCVLRGGGCNPNQPCALHDAWSNARKALLEELRSSPVIR